MKYYHCMRNILLHRGSFFFAQSPITVFEKAWSRGYWSTFIGFCWILSQWIIQDSKENAYYKKINTSINLNQFGRLTPQRPDRLAAIKRNLNLPSSNFHNLLGPISATYTSKPSADATMSWGLLKPWKIIHT